MDNPYIAEAQALLRKFYGYPNFRPAQRPVVESLLSGADTLAIMHLALTESKFPVLTLKPAAYPVLKGQESVFQAVPKPEKEKTPADSGLFDKLRHLRKEIATREHVPPYVVFSDATLRDMCAVQPKTMDEMLEVKGIGERKLERYGEEFLKCILEK